MSGPRASRVERQISRLASRVEQHRQLVESLQRRADRQHADLRRLSGVVDARLRQAQALRMELGRHGGAIRAQLAYSRKFRSMLPSHVRDRVDPLHRLHRIAGSQRPIIVGPWTGEVGYELLYWIPFVRWFIQTFQIDASRLRVLSRGGPTSWYQGIASRYVDALTFYTPDEFRGQTTALAWMKQDTVTSLDRQILRRARQSLVAPRAVLLHPSVMFRMFKGFWGSRMSINDVLASASHQAVTPPDPPPGLPSRYVAVRFYFRSSLPQTPENEQLVARAIRSITAHHDVVLLNPGFRVDDHHDWTPERGRVYTIDHLLTPERNLDVQTAVIGRASAFVGTYGGFAYLAPLLGVRAITVYSLHSFKTCHLELAERVFEKVGGGSLTVLHAKDVELLARVLLRTPGPGH